MNSPNHEELHNRIINASTADEVASLRLEAWAKGYVDIVGEGRQILISSFGYTKGKDGLLIKPEQK